MTDCHWQCYLQLWWYFYTGSFSQLWSQYLYIGLFDSSMFKALLPLGRTRDTRVPWSHSSKPYWSEPLLETNGDQAKCDGNRNGGNRLVGAFSSEWHKMWSRLTAQICHFLWLITRNQDFFDKKCCILMFCDKKCRILTFRNKKCCILTCLTLLKHAKTVVNTALWC